VYVICRVVCCPTHFYDRSIKRGMPLRGTTASEQSILGERDPPNVRTEFTLDKPRTLAKKMFPGIGMHHRMSLLEGKHEEENMNESRYPVGDLSRHERRINQGGYHRCKSFMRVVVGSTSTSASSSPASSGKATMAISIKNSDVTTQLSLCWLPGISDPNIDPPFRPTRCHFVRR